jgi:hypothetical protein
MRNFLIICCFFIVSGSNAQNTNINFNEKLADSLQADAYGMKSYTFVLLQKGNNRTSEANFVKTCFDSHLKNTFECIERGEIIVSGPLGSNEMELRGFFIFKSTDSNEVLKMLQNDLAIKEGLLKATLIPWYGSAALPTFLNTHQKIWTLKP